MELSKRRYNSAKISVPFLLFFVSLLCFLILLLMTTSLPIPSSSLRTFPDLLSFRSYKLQRKKLGNFGEMIVDMLPNDLTFTVFVPSEDAFKRDLGLQENESLIADNWNDTYAVLTRVLGFSAVPLAIFSRSLPVDQELSFDSLSGLLLVTWKDVRGAFMVNGIQAEAVDIRRGTIVVHIMESVIMDPVFQQSYQLV